MKKTFILVAALAVSLMSVTAFAQENKAFSHLSLGPSIGGEGIGIELATTLGGKFQMRAGYSITIPITLSFNLGSMNSSVGGGTSRDLSHVPINFSFFPGGMGNLLFDFYPSDHSVFHITAGAFFGGGNMLKAKMDLSSVLTKDEYGTLAIGMDNGTGATVSSDKEGIVTVDATSWPVKPYVGIGFGRSIHPEKKVSVNFDMGIAVSGSPTVKSYNYVSYYAGFANAPQEVILNSSAIANKDKGALDLVSKVPIMPLLKLTVFFGVL